MEKLKIEFQRINFFRCNGLKETNNNVSKKKLLFYSYNIGHQVVLRFVALFATSD